jgi:hypothetical protein
MFQQRCSHRYCMSFLLLACLLQCNWLRYEHSVSAFHSVTMMSYAHQRNIVTTSPLKFFDTLQQSAGRRNNKMKKAQPIVILFSTQLTSTIDGIIESIATLFGKSNDPTSDRAIQKLREERKLKLLSLVKSINNQGNKVVSMSTEIDDAIDALAEISPITSTISLSEQLQKTWSLVWTTEKEINFFIEKGWSNNITQQIISDNVIVNTIPFMNDNGYFGVRGRIYCQTDDPFIRTQFVFETATLELSRISWLPTLSFPPVGKGWFDTVYLDDNFRVDRNSRNDILICQSL